MYMCMKGHIIKTKMRWREEGQFKRSLRRRKNEEEEGECEKGKGEYEEEKRKERGAHTKKAKKKFQ